MPAWVAPAAYAAGNTGFGLAGPLMANTANRMGATRQFDRYQSAWERNRANDLANWNRNNQYNSPQMQMQRFKEAGLNPHLIYGKGTAGNATAMRSPDIKPYSRAEHKSVTAGIDAFGDFNEFKNIQAQTKNTEAGTILTALQSVNQASETERNFGGEGNNKFTASVDAAIAAARTAEYGTKKAKHDADIRGDDSNISLNTKTARIKIVKKTLANLELDRQGKVSDNAVKAFAAEMARLKIHPNDHMILREIKRVMQNPKEFIKKLLKAHAERMNIPYF